MLIQFEKFDFIVAYLDEVLQSIPEVVPCFVLGMLPHLRNVLDLDVSSSRRRRTYARPNHTITGAALDNARLL